MFHLFPRLFQRRAQNAPPPGVFGSPDAAEETQAQVDIAQAADQDYLAEYAAARFAHGPVWGTATVPPSLKVVFLVAGAKRVLSWVTLTPGSGNSGTIYVGGPGVTSTNGTPLSKTSAPLTLKDVLLGDLAMIGTAAGDVLSFVGS